MDKSFFDYFLKLQVKINFVNQMEQDKFIDIQKLIASKNPKAAKWIPGFVMRYLKRILHQDEINAFLVKHKNDKNEVFCDHVMEYFNIKVIVDGMEKIPKEGKVILAMNHPLGGMDAIALVSALQNHRKDIKFIVNDLLMNLTNLSELFVGVNKHGKNEKSTRQQLIELFESDQLICIFPAGLVSRRSNGNIRDLEWKKTFMIYAKKHNHVIMPIHIDGKLSRFFYNLANFRQKIGIKANIEMLYLSNELFKQRNRTIRFTVGDPIVASDLSTSKTELELAQDIRAKVYELEPKN